MRKLHDRMPVIIPREAYGVWLDNQLLDAERLAPLLRPCPAGELLAHPVSNRVNNPRYDDPSCLQAVG
jgi:putative SOS response-associated peptidase YedK